MTWSSACRDGFSSSKFAVGRYPQEVVHAIRAVSKEVDCERCDRQHVPGWAGRKHSSMAFDREQAAVAWAESTERLRCVVAISNYAPNALKVYRKRPRKPVVIVTNQSSTARYLQLFGVYGVWVDYRWEDEDRRAIARTGLEALGWCGTEKTAL